MTPTERLLQQFLVVGTSGLLLSCTPTPTPVKEGGRYCIFVDQEASCPTVEDLNENTLPSMGESCDPCQCVPREYLEVTELMTDNGEECCYKANYSGDDLPEGCAVGRPLIESGTTKVAQTRFAKYNPWRKSIPKIVSSLSTEERFKIGKFYLQTALYEHASVASFQKFCLDLMRFGAPPDLLRRAQQASMDEILHAQLAFSIAGELLGRQAQPGQLDYTPSLSQNLVELATSTLHEGAIGETVAVLLAIEQLRHTTEPSIRKFWQQVIEDESKHAELAWETLRWCIKQQPKIKDRIQEAINQQPKYRFSHYPDKPNSQLGIPTISQLQEIQQRGWTQVILPSLQSLLG